MSPELDIGRFDPAALELVTPTGERIALTPIECRLLAWFIANPGRVVSREELLREVWGYAGGVRSRTVYTTIGRLRQKIERDPQKAEILVTDPGGYRLVP